MSTSKAVLIGSALIAAALAFNGGPWQMADGWRINTWTGQVAPCSRSHTLCAARAATAAPVSLASVDEAERLLARINRDQSLTADQRTADGADMLARYGEARLPPLEVPEPEEKAEDPAPSKAAASPKRAKLSKKAQELVDKHGVEPGDAGAVLQILGIIEGAESTDDIKRIWVEQGEVLKAMWSDSYIHLDDAAKARRAVLRKAAA